MKDYTVNVNFATYVGGDELYEVSANSEEEAEHAAFELAKEDLEVIDIAQIDNNEWEVTVGFAAMIGIEQTYTVYGSDEDEASDAALEEASYDLNAEVVSDDDIEGSTDVKCSSSVFDLPSALMDVVDQYNGVSSPVSGDWATETEHEMKTIADAFGISLESAKALMINELGFDPEEF